MFTIPMPMSSEHFMRGRIDVLTSDIRFALLTSAYTLNGLHKWFSDVSDAEVVAAGYDAGGKQLQNRTCELDPNITRTPLLCDPLLWSVTGWVHRYGMLYAFTGDYATSPLMALWDWGSDITVTEPLPVSFPDGAYRMGP